MLTDLYTFRRKTLNFCFFMNPLRVNNIGNKNRLLSYSSEKYENTVEALKSLAKKQKSLATGR